MRLTFQAWKNSWARTLTARGPRPLGRVIWVEDRCSRPPPPSTRSPTEKIQTYRLYGSPPKKSPSILVMSRQISIRRVRSTSDFALPRIAIVWGLPSTV